MRSFKKKIVTLISNGIDPYIEGRLNFENPSEEIESIAKERLKYCNCLVEEPIEFLRVEDKRIPELSNMMCDICGCTASYKFRQSIKKCEKWQK